MPGLAAARRWAVSRLVVALLLAPTMKLHAAPSAAPWRAPPSAASRAELPWSLDGNQLDVSVITMGPGDHPFLKFGHNAIWLHDRQSGRDALYNFGTFAFTPTLIRDFMKGRLEYWLSVQSLTSLAGYEQANRSITFQPLRLEPATKAELAARLTENARPEHKAYKYDYYRDNCSTRVRDVIDRALGGQLRRASQGQTNETYRSHTLRLVADELWLYIALDLALARDADQPLREWDELFLPEKTEAALARLVIDDGGQAARRLVTEQRLAFRAERPALRSAPPNWVPQALGLGALLGALLLALGGLGARSRAARSGFLLLSGLVSALLGLLGTVFAVFWCSTNHTIAHRNENLLQCPPLALLLALSAGVALFRPGRESRVVFYLATACAALSFLGLLLKMLPSFIQDNALVIAFTLPVWLGLAAGSRALLRGVSRARVSRPPAVRGQVSVR